MNLDSIMDQIEREKRKELVVKMYDDGINCENDHVKASTAQTLWALAKVDSAKFAELYIKALGELHGEKRDKVAETLWALAEEDPKKYAELYEEGIKIKYDNVADATYDTLWALGSVDPDKCMQLCERGMEEKGLFLLNPYREAMKQLAERYPERTVKLYEKGMSSEDEKVREVTARCLGYLADISPEKYIELFDKGMNDQSMRVRGDVAGTLKHLARTDQQKYLSYYENGMRLNMDFKTHLDPVSLTNEELSINYLLLDSVDFDSLKDFEKINYFNGLEYLRRDFTKTISGLAKVNPQKYIELYKRGLRSNEPEVRYDTARTLDSLAQTDPKKYAELCEKGMNSKDAKIRSGTVWAMGALASIDPVKFVQLFERGFKEGPMCSRDALVEKLHLVAEIDVGKYIEFFEIGMHDTTTDRYRGRYIQNNTERKLGALAKVDAERYLQLAKKYKIRTSSMLHNLADSDPEQYIKTWKDFDVNMLLELEEGNWHKCEKGDLKSRYQYVKSLDLSTIQPLARLDPALYSKLFQDTTKASKHRSTDTHKIALELPVLAETITDKHIEPIKDEEYILLSGFVEKYLGSRYFEENTADLTQDEVIADIRRIFYDSELDPVKMGDYLANGLCLEEAMECAKVDIKDYKIIRRLGEGADGIVYQAKYTFLGDVKLKIFKDPEDKIKEAVEKEGVSLEQRIQARMMNLDNIEDMRHITIFKGVDRCKNPRTGKDTIYLALEFVDGGAVEFKDINGYHIRDDIVTEEDIISIYSRFLTGLETIHDAGKVLKDVKLRNLLVSYDHNKVKIDDLETIAGIEEIQEGKRFTMGSDRYAAPESLADIKDATQKSDLYSAAVCLLYMVTKNPTLMLGINNLDQGRYDEQLDKMLNKQDLKDHQIKFFKKALAYKPMNRYKHILDFQEGFQFDYLIPPSNKG